MADKCDDDAIRCDQRTCGWDQYRMLIVTELKRIEALMIVMQGDISEMKIEIGQLRVKAGVWGALGGLMAGIGGVGTAVMIAWVKWRG